MVIYNIKEKIAVINLLSLIMEADKVVNPKEVEYMDEVMKALNITVSDLDKMENKDIESNKFVFEQMTPDKKMEAMAMFRHMAAVDGYIDPREMAIIEDL